MEISKPQATPEAPAAAALDTIVLRFATVVPEKWGRVTAVALGSVPKRHMQVAAVVVQLVPVGMPPQIPEEPAVQDCLATSPAKRLSMAVAAVAGREVALHVLQAEMVAEMVGMASRLARLNSMVWTERMGVAAAVAVPANMALQAEQQARAAPAS